MKPDAQRKREERDRYRAAGYTPVQVWVKPEDRPRVQKYAERLNLRRIKMGAKYTSVYRRLDWHDGKTMLGDWVFGGTHETLDQARDSLALERSRGYATRILHGNPDVAGDGKIVEETTLTQTNAYA